MSKQAVGMASFRSFAIRFYAGGGGWGEDPGGYSWWEKGGEGLTWSPKVEARVHL